MDTCPPSKHHYTTFLASTTPAQKEPRGNSATFIWAFADCGSRPRRACLQGHAEEGSCFTDKLQYDMLRGVCTVREDLMAPWNCVGNRA